MNKSITDFSQCHARIISQLMKFSGLPGLLDQPTAARAVAVETLYFFRATVFKHHTEEERDLFPLILARAAHDGELETVKAMVLRLTQEHRGMESKWVTLEPALAKIADGKTVDLDAATVETLVLDYAAHASFEEAEFLPLCRTILARTRKHISASDLSHHLVYAPTVPARL